MYQLISATPSPYARKVRIALAEKGLPFELLTEVPWNSTSITPRYNPLEKLPILLLDDGTSVYESSYILQYLELKHPQVPLLPKDIDGHLAARKLEVLCDGVCDAVVLALFEKMRAGGGSPEWLARQRRKIEGGVAEMARLVGQRQWASALAWETLPSAPPLVTCQCGFRTCPGARCTPTWPCSVTGSRSGHRSGIQCRWRRRLLTRWCEGRRLSALWDAGQFCYYCNSYLCIFHEDYGHF